MKNDNSPEETVPSIIARIMKDRKMSRCEIAKSIGVQWTTVSRWENGIKPRRAGLDALKALAAGQVRKNLPDTSLASEDGTVSIRLTVHLAHIDSATAQKIRATQKILTVLESLCSQ